MVGEYFGGLSATLGRVVVAAASSLRFDVTWAAILVVSLCGIVLYLGVVVLERVLIPWHPSIAGTSPPSAGLPGGPVESAVTEGSRPGRQIEEWR